MDPDRRAGLTEALPELQQAGRGRPRRQPTVIPFGTFPTTGSSTTTRPSASTECVLRLPSAPADTDPPILDRYAGFARLIPIDDPADPRLADYVGLTDLELRQRTEAERGCFIVEGPLAIERLIGSPSPPRSVLFTPKVAERLGAAAEPHRRAGLRRPSPTCWRRPSGSTSTGAWWRSADRPDAGRPGDAACRRPGACSSSRA